MFLKSVAAQALYRWPVTLLLYVTLATIVSLYVYLNNSARFSNRSMQLIMKRMGYNLVILPSATPPFDHYACTGAEVVFSEDVCRRMAEDLRMPARYYANILQHRAPAGTSDALLTGVAPVHRADETEEKNHLFRAVPAGDADVGAVLARELELAEGGTISVRGRSFRVAKILPAAGTIDDNRVWVSLETAQEMFGRSGGVNAVFAFLCEIGKPMPRVLEMLADDLAAGFPGFRVIPKMNLLQARFLARLTTSRYLDYLLGFVLLATVLLVMITGLQEVSERKAEVGILLALGAGYPYIAGLYLVKLFFLALVAALSGFFAGSGLARLLLAPILAWETRPIGIVWQLLPKTLGLTCAVVVLAAVVPLVRLVTSDPNRVLVEEQDA